jgi:LmbE family N-acetylglucosaminyl deacetylase
MFIGLPQRRNDLRLQPRRFASFIGLIIFLVGGGVAQEGLPPLPQDTGKAGLLQTIQRLCNTGRLLHTTAHPDDEDGGMLTFMSRGEGVHVMQLTLNRGEGGQNRTGSGLFDELGMLRTLELLAADRYYDVEQRFTRVVDFGFSKSAQETFEKWGGHDIPLSDMVRVIRTFRPDVIISRFQGAPRDGHGHHQAAGILTREAFRAAADPKRFPEQIQEGLLPWQAKKLYVDNVREGEDYTVKFDANTESPLLGMTYQQFAMQGLKHQLSQGAGQWQFPSGPAWKRYKLVDSVLPNTQDPEGHEHDFFDGIDTSISGLARRLGGEELRDTKLAPMFRQLQDKLEEAAIRANKDPKSAAKPLAESLKLLEEIEGEMASAGVRKYVMADILSHLPRRQEIEHAINLAEGVTVEAKLDGKTGPSAQLVVPGQTFNVAVDLHAPAGTKVLNASIVAPDGWGIKPLSADEKNPLQRLFEVKVPMSAAYTKPYYHRDSPQDTIYKIDNPAYLTLPLVSPPITAEVEYEVDGINGRVSDFVKADSVLEDGEREVPLAVAPAASVLFDHSMCVIRQGRQQPVEITLHVKSDVPEISGGVLSIFPNTGWRVEPASQGVELHGKGTEKSFKFYLFPEADKEMRFDIRAKLTVGGLDFYEGFSTVTRADLETGYYYQPAIEHVSVVDVMLPQNYVVGYIMGAGDEIPTTLRQAGLDVKMILPGELASADLNSKYNAIVLGIRAYDVNEDVRKNNTRLLDYVKNGGTLVVQYNAGVQEFNEGNYTPYPATLSRDRVSDETAPVEILDPHDLVMNEPNDITHKDFDGWVQERGLYFMSSWGGKFVPLLSSHDPGEPPRDGGLIRAWYGKGAYIYTGYSFFRELPNGVPGALRLFVNLLSAHQ